MSGGPYEGSPPRRTGRRISSPRSCCWARRSCEGGRAGFAGARVGMKDLSRAAAGGIGSPRARAFAGIEVGLPREMLKARGRDAGVAHHDSRTPSTASRAPSPGSASLGRRLGPSSPAARLSRRVARARAVARNERVNGNLRASACERHRTCAPVVLRRARSSTPRPRRGTGRCWPRRRFSYGRPTNAIFCTAIRRDVLIS